MLGNWIRETTTTTGTGNMTVAAVTGYPRFSTLFALNQRFLYSILADSDGTPIEAGIGYLSATSTLVRERVLATYSSGTYDDTSPAAVSLASGTKRVVCAAVSTAFGSMPYEHQRLPSSGVRGRWGLPGQGHNGAPTGFGHDTAYRWFHPVKWETPGVIDRVSFYASANTANNFRAAIFQITTDGKPGAILADFGATAISGTGIKHSGALGTPIFLPAGEYLVGIQPDTGSISIYGDQYNRPSSCLGIASTGLPVAHLYRAVTYGAFGDESGESHSDGTNGNAAMIINKS